MNKGEFIKAVSEKSNISERDASKIINNALDVITESLKAREKVSITGFGNFEAKIRASRKGRNPATGEIVDIPEKTVPVFRAGKQLKESI